MSCHFKFLNFLLIPAFAVFLISAGPAGAKAPCEADGILLVAFGTSVPEAGAAFKAIDSSFKAAFPGIPIEWAFTSQIIRKKLAARGEKAASIGQGLQALAKAGAKIIRVQSLHVMAGEEFGELARAVLIWTQKHPGVFKSVYLGRPLLESREDAKAAAKAIMSKSFADRADGEALALMAHGQEHGRAGLVLEGTRSEFAEHDPLTFLASVEGDRDFDDLLADLEKSPARKVILAPLMVVAGDHARNDLGGDDADSWASRLKAAGYDVSVVLTGLGEIPEINDIFLRHVCDTRDDLIKEPKKP